MPQFYEVPFAATPYYDKILVTNDKRARALLLATWYSGMSDVSQAIKQEPNFNAIYYLLESRENYRAVG